MGGSESQMKSKPETRTPGHRDERKQVASRFRIRPSFDLRISHFGFHSTFCACSRNFSNSVFKTTTSREIRLSFAFDPMVLISRFISCRSEERRVGKEGSSWCGVCSYNSIL